LIVGSLNPYASQTMLSILNKVPICSTFLYISLSESLSSSLAVALWLVALLDTTVIFISLSTPLRPSIESDKARN